MSDEEAVVSEEESRLEAGGTGEGQAEKLVPVVEAIRYRRRAQAAEKELAELKEVHEKQGKELAGLREKMEGGLKDTPSPLRGTPPLQGESFLVGDHGGAPLRQGESVVVGTAHPTGERAAVKTQGVKETRTGGARVMLAAAAGRAAKSGSRVDLQEYLRARRQYV